MVGSRSAVFARGRMIDADEAFRAVDDHEPDKLRDLLQASPGLAAEHNAEGLSLLLYALYRGRGDEVEIIRAALPALDFYEAAALGDVDRLLPLLDLDPSLARSNAG